MRATIAWWDLSASTQTVDSLREYLRDEGVRPWEAVRGLRLKFWVADRPGNRWGAVMLWEGDGPGDQPLPPHRAAELIGYPPTERVRFDVEATVEGVHSMFGLSGQGPALAGLPPAAPPRLPEFDEPPPEPMPLVRRWFEAAVARGVREPGVLSLATADAAGRTSNRIVQTIRLTGDGLVFTTHATSPKGRDLAATGWASGVLYWRETQQQVTLTGPVRRLPDAESDALWHARPPATHPMSVAAAQSEPLADEEALRAEAARLGAAGTPLARPPAWAGYRLEPTAVEFWHGSPDRLHRRLRYDHDEAGWTTARLQP
ncbi:MAG TPA: phenazine biosynthesis FMN-dependent oxidase PhzG [Pseudonocardiaceae bacterium]